MDIHELFEDYYCDMHSVDPEVVKGWRMINGSYSMPGVATAFRSFRAGFEANSAEKTNATPKKLERTMKSNDLEAQYTAVDMTTAAAQGFRDGVASVIVEFPPARYLPGSTVPLLHIDEVKAAIIAAGGSVKE